MPESFRLHVVSPSGEVLDRQVVEVTAPGLEGQFGILPRHARYMTALGVGELHYVDADGGEGLLVVAGGFAEVSPQGVNVLAQTAEDAEQIDVARAEAALQRAEARLASPEEGTDVERATIALARSRTRLQVAKARGIKPTRTGIKTVEMPIPGEQSGDELATGGPADETD